MLTICFDDEEYYEIEDKKLLEAIQLCSEVRIKLKRVHIYEVKKQYLVGSLLFEDLDELIHFYEALETKYMPNLCEIIYRHRNEWQDDFLDAYYHIHFTIALTESDNILISLYCT